MLRARISTAALVAWTVVSSPAAGQDAADVFTRYSGDVVKVEVLEATTRAPSTIGTAFYADASILLTNYHVVREVLFDPEAYTLRLVSKDGSEDQGASIVAVDPALDLAALRVERTRSTSLRLSGDSVPNGVTLYAIGHPADLRTSVVEGVFNGAVDYRYTPLVHFSGAINPGMSGGPTVRPDGAVVGINVASAGNQLGFLIPAAAAVALLDEARTTESATPAEMRAQASRKLRSFQEDVFGELIERGFSTTTIRGASVPTGPAERFDCAAAPHEVEDDRYEVIEYSCYTEDEMLLGPSGSYDLAYMEHIYLAAGELTTLGFHSLMSQWYQTVLDWELPANEHATAYRCDRDNVRLAEGVEMLVVFCARRHVAHEELHDLFLRTVLLGGGSEAVVSTLRVTSVSFANAVALTDRWLRGFAWVP